MLKQIKCPICGDEMRSVNICENVISDEPIYDNFSSFNLARERIKIIELNIKCINKDCEAEVKVKETNKFIDVLRVSDILINKYGYDKALDMTFKD
jgi:dihydroorotate dehydrogenase